MLLQPRFIQEGCTHKWQLAMGFSFCIGKLAAQGEHCAAITQTQSLDFGRDKPITLVANHSSILAYSCVYLRWSMGVFGKTFSDMALLCLLRTCVELGAISRANGLNNDGRNEW
ncbi:hypothetical protein [Mangrovibacter yixingensis]|uniref:hypothetical protein n=1 Tax=Mangrovibacter yixingensis TaxID=1529639 RepID=UPI001CFBC2D6|nr:hypothetical protein [Mangrovibacter yixingensis]